MKHLIIAFFLLCTSYSYSHDFEITFEHTFGNKPLIWNQDYVTEKGEVLSFEKLKYYVGNIVLTYKSGEKYVDSTSYYLIDGDKPTSFTLQLPETTSQVIAKIEFGVGVDSLTNEMGLISGALDPMNGMYWAWSSGFINFKLEGDCKSCVKEKEFTYHIGGYAAPNPTYQSLEFNFPENQLTGDQGVKINVDLSQFFNNFTLEESPRLMSPSSQSAALAAKFHYIFSIK